MRNVTQVVSLPFNQHMLDNLSVEHWLSVTSHEVMGFMHDNGRKYIDSQFNLEL